METKDKREHRLHVSETASTEVSVCRPHMPTEDPQGGEVPRKSALLIALGILAKPLLIAELDAPLSTPSQI